MSTDHIPDPTKKVPAVGARLDAVVGRLEPERDSGGMTYRWLVENFTPEGQSTGLYMACQLNMTLTADVNAARKFLRQRTAEFRALDMREARRGDWRAVEHGFDDSKTPAGCSENGGLGWCDEHKPEVATRCEGCAELRDQLRDLTRQSNLDAMRVGKLAEDAERHSALHARLFVEKTAAQIDAENLREVLHRMLEAPTTQISAGWKDAIRQAMSAAVPDSKPPNVPMSRAHDTTAEGHHAGAPRLDGRVKPL